MDLTAEQRAVRDVVHEFALEEIRPVARETDADSRYRRSTAATTRTG
jgi:hypothetical protein